jgi:hypothetical protein
MARGTRVANPLFVPTLAEDQGDLHDHYAGNRSWRPSTGGHHWRRRRDGFGGGGQSFRQRGFSPRLSWTASGSAYGALAERAKQLKVVIALGTHQAMSEDHLGRHLGYTRGER